jgi:serine/threonine-protein kinase HipA
MSERELIVLLDETEAGRVFQDRNGRLRFIYEDSWRKSATAYPLSLSMPLQSAEHAHAKITAFLWGLLPDNSAVLQTWATRFQVSPRNPFALIANVGEDCAGAVQLVRPERLTALRSAKARKVEWLTLKEIGKRLQALRSDHGAWRVAGDTGQFSLAGAQPKTALLFEKNRWGVPSGRTPTTHILKPPVGALDGFAENEHFCLELARALGLPAADSRVEEFGDEIAIVVARYDRTRTREGWRRIHQEDFCQAASVPPAKKYQNEGGPGARDIAATLRTYSGAAEEDVTTFVDALALSWLIAGTDAHAKNYSLLIAPGRVRLAPLYDLASVLPYPRFDLKEARLAMKIGGQYRVQRIGLAEWRRLAADLTLDPTTLIDRIVSMARSIPDRALQIARDMKKAGLKHDVIDRLATRLAARARLSLTQLKAG